MIVFIFGSNVAARDAYYADVCARFPPRRCPQHLIAPGTPEAACWTNVPVESLDLGGIALCGAYPGEPTPAGATRERIQRSESTGLITSRVAVAEPTTRQLADALAAKIARQPRELAIEPERER